MTIAVEKNEALLWPLGESAFSQIRISREARLVITLLGKTGSGKGTVGIELAKRFNIVHISLGDLYRDAIKEGKGLARIIEFQAKNNISYDVHEVCVGMLLERIQKPDCDRGFILDGFPRTAPQANVLVRAILHPRDIHIPIELEITDALILERLTKRFFCKPCNAQVRGHELVVGQSDCLTCHTPLSKRSDDEQHERILHKLKHHESTISEVRAAIIQKFAIDRIDVEKNDSPQNVFDRVYRTIEYRLNRYVVSSQASIPQNVV